jgi:hypothetical protein
MVPRWKFGDSQGHVWRVALPMTICCGCMSGLAAPGKGTDLPYRMLRFQQALVVILYAERIVLILLL